MDQKSTHNIIDVLFKLFIGLVLTDNISSSYKFKSFLLISLITFSLQIKFKLKKKLFLIINLNLVVLQNSMQ